MYAWPYRDGSDFNSIESCNLSGTGGATILAQSDTASFAWIAPSRFIYTKLLTSTQLNTDESRNLWELTVDPQSGAPQGTTRRLTDWSGSESKPYRLQPTESTSRSSAVVLGTPSLSAI